MPVLLDPNQQYPIVLDGDTGKDPQPVFFAKAQSMRSQRRIADLVDKWSQPDESTTVASLFTESVTLLGEVLVGWENIVDPDTSKNIPYTTEAIEDWLTYLEVRELINKVMYNSHLDNESKKNLESQHSSEPESCVETVEVTV